MSQAFVKENDSNELLHHIAPTITALLKYIKSENNNSTIFVKQTNKINGVQVVTLNNGFSYFINKDYQWEMHL